MASYQTTGSYLRNSVFDAALEIGLGDPNLANWLDDLPEVAEEKTDNSAPFSVPSSTAGHEPWISSPDSELSHSSTANTLTTVTSNSSQGSFHYTTPSRHPNPSPRIPTPRAVLPDKLELKGSNNTNAPTSAVASSENTLHSSPFILPLQPQKRAATKLLKKGRGDKKGSREKDQDNSTAAEGTAPAAAVPYSFLQHEPTPPPSDHEKTGESKGFFGRLRDRSRSKSRAARKASSRPSEDVEKDASADSLLTAAATAVADRDRRGREFERKDVQQRPGGVTVVKVNEGGLPQLQLDPLSNRKSADLLSALTAEFSLVAATAAESSEKEKEAIAAYYAGVLNNPPVVEQQPPPTTTTAPTADVAAVAPGQPIPRLKSVMDRPHPKVRTSGFWANKDRGVMVPGAANRRVARKASASRRASVRGAVAGGAGVRRAPSHKRKSSALGGGKAAMAAGSRASRRLSINGLIDAIREEGVAGTEETTTTTDFEEVETDSDDDGDPLNRPTSLPYSAQPAKKKGSTTSDSEPVPAIPVIIERRPSTKSTRSSKPNLSLTLNNLMPGSTTQTQRLSPSSPMRSPGSRFRRSSHGSGLPSPLKPPPTSPLPPTPDVGGAQVLSVADRPQSGVVTPTAAKAVLATMPSPRQSDWFEDEEEDSDVDVGRRTPFSRTPGTSRPASPSDEWIVPTPTSVVTTFQPPPTTTTTTAEFNKPIPRPVLTGRAPATAEARARATASAAMSRTGSTLVIPAPNGIPATPRRPGTSPQPTGRATPTAGHLRVRPAETLRGTTPPPPSTWNPPTSALTRISSMRSQRGREPEGQKQPQQQQQARSHSRDDSNGSNASGSQRGRMSPFPVRPGGSRDVSPLPSLKRTPSKMSIRQKTERVRSHHAELGGDFDVEVFGRQSGESVRSGESEGWATASSTRSSNEGARSARPGNYNGVPREAYMPSPSPMTARRPGTHSRGPSPLPPLSATLPLNPSPHRPGSRMATTPNPTVGRPPHPTLRPSASFTIPRPQQFSASNLAPSSSLRIDRNSSSRASMRSSAYSALSDDDDDDARSFRGLDLDDDRPMAGKGFDVIAARLGDPSSKSAKLLQRLAVEDAEEDVLPPKGRGSGVTRPPAPSLLKVPQRPMTGPNSPNLSPRLRNVPTPTSAGGARWI